MVYLLTTMYESAVDVKHTEMNENTDLLSSGLSLSMSVSNSNNMQVYHCNCHFLIPYMLYILPLLSYFNLYDMPISLPTVKSSYG